MDDDVGKRYLREEMIENWSVLLYIACLLLSAFIGGPVIGLEDLAVQIGILSSIIFWVFVILWFLFLKNYIWKRKVK